jgi:PhnB protein
VGSARVVGMTPSPGDGVVPAGYSRVDPWVVSADTDAEIAFLGEVFGAAERPGSRMLGPDGAVAHVEVAIGGSVLLMFDRRPEWAPMPAALRVYVDDADAAFDRAVRAGAQPITRVTELAFGERVARIRDPQGHLWWIHQRVETLDMDEMGRRFADPAYQAAMAYVQESLSTELAD